MKLKLLLVFFGVIFLNFFVNASSYKYENRGKRSVSKKSNHKEKFKKKEYYRLSHKNNLNFHKKIRLNKVAYISEGTKFIISTKKYGDQKIDPLEGFEQAAGYLDELKVLCDDFDFSNNNLFVSLQLGFGLSEGKDFQCRNYFLHYNRGFIFKPLDKKEGGCLANFSNLVNKEEYSNLGGKKHPFDDDQSVIFTYYPSKDREEDYIIENNETHSEIDALSILKKDEFKLIASAINELPQDSVVKLINVRLHSYLEHCEKCEESIEEFQEDLNYFLKTSRFSDRLKNRYLGSKNKEKKDNFCAAITGLCNKKYRKKRPERKAVLVEDNIELKKIKEKNNSLFIFVEDQFLEEECENKSEE